MKVVVIDDSRLSVSALQNMLSDMGHTVVDVAYTGEDGLGKVKEHSPDVICLDQVMPGIDGRETAQKLQSITKAKIVMITAKPLEDEIKQDIRAAYYIVKPITRSKLEQAFSNL